MEHVRADKTRDTLCIKEQLKRKMWLDKEVKCQRLPFPHTETHDRWSTKAIQQKESELPRTTKYQLIISTSRLVIAWQRNPNWRLCHNPRCHAKLSINEELSIREEHPYIIDKYDVVMTLEITFHSLDSADCNGSCHFQWLSILLKNCFYDFVSTNWPMEFYILKTDHAALWMLLQDTSN
jgi:hypothetical protein